MYKIMLADDEGIVIDSLKFIIEKEFGDTCVIESAKTGRSVIELAENFRPDIAFMDIQMPGINGIEAMREIKESSKNTIFIVMSAYDKFDYAREAINLGVLEYLNKPVERTKIVQVVRKAMSLIDEEREKRSNELLTREKLENVVPIIENGLIYNILFQEHFEEDIQNFMALLGIEQKYGYMGVLICGDKQEGNHMTNAVGASVRAQNCYTEIREIVREFFPNCIMGAIMANKIAFFIPSSKNIVDYNERTDLIEKSRELVRKLRKRVDIAFRVGIGSVRDLHDAGVSYNEAINSLVDTTGSVAHVDDLPVRREYADKFPIDVEERLFESLNKGDLNACLEACNTFFDWMEENYADYMTDIKLKVLEFVLWGEHFLYLSGGHTYHFLSRSDYLPTLLELSTYEEIRRWFLEHMTTCCRNININVKKEEQSISVIAKAKNYIDSHYMKDIALDDVSREVDISPYYFSKIFKDEMGENFIEYLTSLRMDKAKELLQQSDYSMKEICGMVGYSDPNYFSRSFKKKVGVTPTEFKANL